MWCLPRELEAIEEKCAEKLEVEATLCCAWLQCASSEPGWQFTLGEHVDGALLIVVGVLLLLVGTTLVGVNHQLPSQC